MRNAALVRSLQTAKTNQTLTWTNPKTGNSGTIKPLSGYTKAANSQSCRDFGESYTRDGHTYTQQSRACRDPNGEWKVVSS
jgi:surface antigen